MRTAEAVEELEPAERPARILVAEDDRHTRTLVRDLCESAGYEVVLAENGEEALEKLSCAPDLLLLDLMMPLLDGYGVLRRLRGENGQAPFLPVILLTALDDVEGKLKGIELGADDYVTKPFRLIELQTRIRAALAVRRYRGKVQALEEELAAVRDGEQGSASIVSYPQLKAGLAYELVRARRYGRPLSALVLSVDDFPLLRAKLGEAGLQQVLEAVIERLRESLRLPDRLYRMDQEVFVVLLPEAGVEGARVVAERLVKALAALGPWEGRRISASVGVASFPERGSEQPEELLREANSALQRAQREAPGSVEVASAHPGTDRL